MKNEHYHKIMELSNVQAREFFLLYVGLDCFIKKQEIIILNKKNFLKEIKNNTKNDYVLWNPYSFRLKIIENDTFFYILYRNIDRKICILHDSNTIEFIEMYFFQTLVPEKVISFLIDCYKNNINTKNTYENVFSLMELKNINSFFEYKFIIGSGIGSEYSIPSWSDLQKHFQDFVDRKCGKTVCHEINEHVFNNNYGYFQILKDVCYEDYKKEIVSIVNSSATPEISDNSTLIAIVKVLYAQNLLNTTKIQNILTFNFDDLIERALKNCYHEESQTIYKNSISKKPLFVFPYSIIHTHGYIPKSPEYVLKEHFDSVVLTTDEYFENYKKPSSFAYLELYNFLNQTCCFVGNSIKDYEEQKVISNHFKKHPESFHFAYFSYKGLSPETIIYTSFFLLKIGIISLWYCSHDDYKKELTNYADKIFSSKFR